jgi:hypothetical protein
MRDDKCYKIIDRIPEGERSLGRPCHRWKDNIKIDLGDTECEVMNWIHL